MKTYIILISSLIILFSCKKEEKAQAKKTIDVVFSFESGCQGYDVTYTNEDKQSKSATSGTSGTWSYTFKASPGDELYFFGREYQCYSPGYYRNTWRMQVDGKEVGYLNDTGSHFLKYTIPL